MSNLEKVIQIIESEVITGPHAPVTESTRLDDLGIDSLELLSLYVRVSDEVGLVARQDYKNIQTVADLVNYASHISQ